MYKWLVVCFLIVGLSGCATQRIAFEGKRPLFKTKLSHTTIEPGHALKLQVTSETADHVFHLSGFDQEQKLQALADKPKHSEGFLAVPLDTVEGLYDILLQVTLKNEVKYKKTFSIMVVPRSPFKTTKLWIKSFGKYDFSSESKIMATARKKEVTHSGGALESFDWPVKGRITEVFGVKRIYNNGLNSWYHGGLDIAAPGGTIISAPADGQVVLVRAFKAHGNATLINHGFGVITTYLHQKKVLVEEGAVIKKGHPIGEVGTTGSSTGNHLHFQVNINSIICDPYDFINSKFQTK